MDVMHPYRHSEAIPEVKGVQAFPPVFFNNKLKQKMEGKTKMNCPKCGKICHLTTSVRGVSTLLGTGAGGYAAAASGAKAGAVVGSFVNPGFGTAIGGFLGMLIGAAAGAAAGNTVGKLLDENVFRMYRCSGCGYVWRAEIGRAHV